MVIPYYRQHKPLGGDDGTMPGQKSAGFQSHCPTHLHVVSVHAIPAYADAHRKLCMGCYIKDYEKRYPDFPLPFTPLKDKDGAYI
jgi:hypothetical protein